MGTVRGTASDHFKKPKGASVSLCLIIEIHTCRLNLIHYFIFHLYDDVFPHWIKGTAEKPNKTGVKVSPLAMPHTASQTHVPAHITFLAAGALNSTAQNTSIGSHVHCNGILRVQSL